jgi:hypothetical protein
MPLPKHPAAFRDLDPVFNMIIELGGLSITPTENTVRFRLRCNAYRRILAEVNDPRAGRLYQFHFKVKGDKFTAEPADVGEVKTLDGKEVTLPEVDPNQTDLEDLEDPEVNEEAEMLRQQLMRQLGEE